MRDKKLQVFVSSTYTDLKEERQAAVEAILSSGNIPAGMELFSAGDETQMTVIKRWIDESDIYLLILGGRYGSIDNISKKSYTHLEYEYALEQKKPLFAVVVTEESLNKKIKEVGRSVIEEDSAKELKEFRKLVTSNIVRFWDDKKDIKIAIHETLADFEHRKDLMGWVRGDHAIDAAPLAEQIAALVKENSELRMKVNQTSSVSYAGLSFLELKGLLEKEKIIVEEKEIDLFQLLLVWGKDLAIGISSGTMSEVTNALTKFKLVRYDEGTYFNTYQFTEDGHNFYLKVLATIG